MISCGCVDPKVTATYPITRIFSWLKNDSYELFAFCHCRSRNNSIFILKLQSSRTLLSFPKIFFFSSVDNKPEPQVIACSPMETGALDSKKKFAKFSLNRKSKYEKACGTFSRSHICISKGDTCPLFASSSVTHTEI